MDGIQHKVERILNTVNLILENIPIKKGFQKNKQIVNYLYLKIKKIKITLSTLVSPKETVESMNINKLLKTQLKDSDWNLSSFALNAKITE